MLPVAILIFLSGIVYVSFISTQRDFHSIILGYFISFVGYFILLEKYFNIKELTKVFIGVFFISRILLFFNFPNLSDDIYRFVWDGLLIHEGINPLSYTPTQLMALPNIELSEFEMLYDSLNSQDYFTIYPPISQLIFYLCTVGSFSVLKSAFVIRLFILGMETMGLYFFVRLLKAFNLNPNHVFIYALNPLIAIEMIGNLHFESSMIAFFIIGIFCLFKKRYFVSSLFIALSIATKLLPLMFLPFIAYYLWSRRMPYLKYFGSMGLFLLVLFSPFFMSLDIPHFMQSLDLYFQKFEFNGSIYYILRAIGKWLTGYNQIAVIGPLLGLVTLGSVLWLTIKEKPDTVLKILKLSMLAFVIYLLLATTVHPWYLAFPLALTVFHQRYFIIFWSLLIIISYSVYSHPDFEPNLWLISLEYLLLAVIIIFELGILKNKMQSESI